jgi:acyl dehydratase
MKFSDLTSQRRFILGPITLDIRDAIDFATKYDPQWFHTDPAQAESGPWDGLIASGWHTCALAMRLICENILAGSESYASPGLNYIRWPNPVRPGDELTLEVLVHEARVSASKPWLGIVRWQWVMRNQSGLEVLDMEPVSLFKLEGDTSASQAANEQPAMAASPEQGLE